ncbi:MAG: binding domain protein [Clostridia bacterium]|jgi:S1 RNA binding domain protein|nr:yugI [Clostridiales bacterium]MDK2985344.1 binding domain protein [Clostridia bacterium]
MSNVEVGSIVEGVITGITNFGAFVEMPGGQTGLVHISEVADTYVKNVKDYLKENDKVKVKVINIQEGGKIGLSIKQADPNYKANKKHKHHSRKNDISFEDKLAKFMKESDEKMAALRKNTESKRGRGNNRY